MSNLSQSEKKDQGNCEMNQQAFSSLKEQGFRLPAIRNALINLNEIDLQELAFRTGVSKTTMYDTVKGRGRNVMAIRGFASELGLDANDIFSDVLVIKV